MILKASQRGGGQDLAAHLMRTEENEHVELHDVRGFVGETLPQAFKEAHAIARGTRCRQYLFSLSLNPPEAESVPPEVFEAAIDRIEKKLGLDGQPRAIVFHEKEGRRHAHCVWSRIDADAMKAIPLPYFKLKLRDISRELYLEHQWKMPRGLMNSAERDPANFSLAEWQQAKRAGIDAKELKSTIQDCWAVSDSRGSFERALQERGFWLARGDRRGHVVMDYQGEVYALSRALNLTAKDVRGRLGDKAALRSVTETRAMIAQRMTPAIKRHIGEARTSFREDQARLAFAKAQIVQRHQAERAKLKADHDRRTAEEALARARAQPKGLRRIWAWVSGSLGRIKAADAADLARAQERDNRERQAMIKAQLAERRSLQFHIRAARSEQAQLLRDLRADVGRYLRFGLSDPPALTHDPDRPRRRTGPRLG
jgi:hypothetical protein